MTVLSVFALGWAVTGISGLSERPTWWTWAGMAASLGFTAALVRMAGRTTPTSSPTVRSRARAFTGVVIVELMTIAVTVVVLSALDAAAFIPGAVALVVGAHFFALAKVFDLPLYRLTGSWLCVVAVGALGTSVFDGPAGQAVAGTGAATALWTTAWALACGRVRRGAR